MASRNVIDDFESKFYEARLNGDTKSCLEFLLNHSKELDTKAMNEKGILLLVVKNDNTEIVSELLKLNLDVNIKNSDGETPLSIASKLGNLTVVNLLLENGAKINVKDSEYGETALHKAVWNGNVEIVETLLANGANGNIKDNQEGWTPLHVAVYTNNLKVVKTLLKYQAGINIRDNDQEHTPLHLAFMIAYKEGRSLCEGQLIDVIEALLKGGSDPNLKMNIHGLFDITPLQFIVEITASRYMGNEKEWSSFNLILSHLILYGANMNVLHPDFNGNTPLQIAIDNENFSSRKKPVIVEKLLELEEEGCLDLNLRNYFGDTALEETFRQYNHPCRGKRLNIVKMLIFHKC